MLTGLLVLIRLVPRILGQAIEVRTFPVGCIRLPGRLRNESLQPLIATWITEIIQFVKIECGHHTLQILLGTRDPGFGGSLHDAWHDNCRKDSEDDDDDQDLD